MADSVEGYVEEKRIPHCELRTICEYLVPNLRCDRRSPIMTTGLKPWITPGRQAEDTFN